MMWKTFKCLVAEDETVYYGNGYNTPKAIWDDNNLETVLGEEWGPDPEVVAKPIVYWSVNKDDWIFSMPPDMTPSWWTQDHEDAVWTAHATWVTNSSTYLAMTHDEIHKPD